MLGYFFLTFQCLSDKAPQRGPLQIMLDVEDFSEGPFRYTEGD